LRFLSVRCFAQFYDKPLNALEESFKEISNQLQYKGFQILSENIIGGLIRGSKHWPYHKHLAMRSSILPVLEQFITRSRVSLWNSGTYSFAFRLDLRRIHWLYSHFEDLFFRALTDPIYAPQALCRILDFLHLIYYCITWRGYAIGKAFLTRILTHKYLYDAPPLVRNTLSPLLEKILDVLAVANRHPETKLPTLESFLPEPDPLADVQQLFEQIATKILEWKLKPASNNHLRLPEKKTERRNRFIDCVLSIIIAQENSHSLKRMMRFVFPLFPVALLLVDDEQVEISRLAWSVLGFFAHVELDRVWTEKLFLVCLTMLNGKFELPNSLSSKFANGLVYSWRVHCGILNFLQAFLFQNIVYLTRAHVDMLLETLRQSLVHPQVEVRNSACATFSVVLHFLDESNHVQLWKEFSLAASERIGFGKSYSPQELINRHRAVLVMAAVVNAHPYSLPSWFPECLVEFATHIHDPMPIKVCVNTTSFLFFTLTYTLFRVP
jgi:hypothetical protein